MPQGGVAGGSIYLSGGQGLVEVSLLEHKQRGEEQGRASSHQAVAAGTQALRS